MNDEIFMKEAIRLSQLAVSHGNEPFGAVLVKDGEIIFSNENQIYTGSDPTFHAEAGLLRRFCAETHITDLREYTLYSSCEPCFMCCGAMVWTKLGRLVYGAVLMTGGTHEGNYYQPTVLKDVTPDMRIFYEESFGPVTSIIKAMDAQDAVRLCNDNQYGLSSSLLTNDLSKAMSLSLDMEAGMVHINNATVSDNSTVAFGGVKNSGVGREGGSYSIDEFTELKWITVQYTPAQLPF